MIVPDTRNIGPHVGIIKFNIFIHKMLSDGSVDPQIVDCSEDFRENEITNLGEIHVIGYDKWDCIKKVKNILENLGENKNVEI